MAVEHPPASGQGLNEQGIEATLREESDTLALAAKLSGCLPASAIIFLNGHLGAGKTTFCRGLLRGLGHEGAVKSPTFTLVEPYDILWGQVYHFDLYRLADPEELEYLGVDDYLAGDAVCLIEWPERGTGWLPVPDLQVYLAGDGASRRVKIEAGSPKGQLIVSQLKEARRRPIT